MQSFLGFDRFRGQDKGTPAESKAQEKPTLAAAAADEKGNNNDLSSTAAPGTPTGNKNPFLHAWQDPLANLKTIAPCVQLADLNGDGESKLLICDLDKKLKVYKGTALASESSILDLPVALSVIYTDMGMPRIPSIAVAAGSHVFIYRQLRPYRKWSCPFTEISPSEADIWASLKTGEISAQVATKQLVDLRDNGTALTGRSLDLISFDSDDAKMGFVQDMKDVNYQQQTLITCMDILKHESDEPDAIGHLVVGTESKIVYILPTEMTNSNFLCKVKLPSQPVMFSITGQFQVEWKISVACRDGKLYTIRQGDVRGTALLSGSVIDLTSPAICMIKQEKSLWIATMDKIVSCYSSRGKRTKTIVFNDDISDMTILSVRKAKVHYLLAIAFINGDVKLYREGEMIYCFKMEKPILGMRFGSYGREENALVFVHGKGSLSIKIWRRSADVDSMKGASGPPPEQDIPLPVPKKTKLYVEQTQREKEQGPAMHRAFHKDLCRMRLETARAYVKTLTEGYMGTAPMGSADIRIQVQVLGLGPSFVLKVTLQNAGSQPLNQSRILFTFDPNVYVMGHVPESKQCIPLSPLLPGVKHIVEAHIMNIDPQGRGGQIMILLHHANSSSSLPLLSASVKMPVSELATN